VLVNALAERLRTAAEKWAQLDHAATWGPWSVHESWAGKCAVVTDGGHPIAIVSHGEPSDTAKADAELIARSRPLAPVIAEQLRAAAERFDAETSADRGECPWCADGYCRGHAEVTSHSDGCEGDLLVDGEPLPTAWPEDACTCFDDALALADAILGPVTA
jgi:hypothetical protein